MGSRWHPYRLGQRSHDDSTATRLAVYIQAGYGKQRTLCEYVLPLQLTRHVAFGKLPLRTEPLKNCNSS